LHHGERQVEAELAPLFFGVPEDCKIFLSSQLEDEARHTVFFDRFYREVVGLTGDGIMDVLDGSWQWIQEVFVGPFGLLSYLTDELRRDPYNKNFARDRQVLPAYYTGFAALRDVPSNSAAPAAM
jgi:ribonucleoside-diphosphate reductase beta chain